MLHAVAGDTWDPKWVISLGLEVARPWARGHTSPRDWGCCLLTWQIFCEKLSTSSFLSCLSCESCSCSPRRLSLASDSTSCSSFICNSPGRGWERWAAPGRTSPRPTPMRVCSFSCPRL